MPMRSRFLSPLIWTLVLTGLGAVGLELLATWFMAYDDEGYVLWSVRMFCEGHPLYAEVYSQYGPLFFVGYRLLHAITGITFDNETGRLLTLAYWVGTAFGAGLIAQWLTRRLLAGLLTAVLTFAFLFANIAEPFHPGSLLALLSAAAAGLGVWFISSGRMRHFTWSIALIAVAMALIKINVGLFLVAALGGWMLLHTRWPSRFPVLRSAAPALVGALSVISVFLLLRSKFAESGRLAVGVIFICGLLSLLSQLNRARSDLLGPRDWRLAAFAAACVVFAVTVAAWLWSTPPALLIHSVLLAPLLQPGVPPALAPGAIACALVALACLFTVTRVALKPRWLDAIACLQLAAAGFFLHSLLAKYPLSTGAWVSHTYAFAPSLAALFTLQTDGIKTSPQHQARLWLAWVFIWQTLHAYPVAGSQLAWGCLLFIPLLVAGSLAAAEQLQRRTKLARPLILAGLSLAAVLAAGQLVHRARSWSPNCIPLDLPGARWLRLHPDLADPLRVLHRNLVLHADTVYSYPGMFSFNIWTGKPTPTAANATMWFSLLGEAQQSAILEKLRADARACVIINHQNPFISGLGSENSLKDFLFADFAPAIRVGDYELWVKRGRRIPALDTFRLDASFARAWISSPSRPVARAVLAAQGRQKLDLEWTLTPAASEASPARLDVRVPVAWVGAARIYLLDDRGFVVSVLLQNEAPNDAALSLFPSLSGPAP